jgi:hypothetical protein
VLQRLKAIVQEKLRALCDREWPFYVEELVGWTAFQVLDEECPSCSPGTPQALPMVLPKVANGSKDLTSDSPQPADRLCELPRTPSVQELFATSTLRPTKIGHGLFPWWECDASSRLKRLMSLNIRVDWTVYEVGTRRLVEYREYSPDGGAASYRVAEVL